MLRHYIWVDDRACAGRSRAAGAAGAGGRAVQTRMGQRRGAAAFERRRGLGQGRQRGRVNARHPARRRGREVALNKHSTELDLLLLFLLLVLLLLLIFLLLRLLLLLLLPLLLCASV